MHIKEKEYAENKELTVLKIVNKILELKNNTHPSILKQTTFKSF